VIDGESGEDRAGLR